MPALMLGAVAFAAPAMAQNDAATAGSAADQTAMNGQPSSSTAASSSSAGSQMAMNTTGNAGDLSSIPDTKQKYSRAKRSANFQSEAETTKQLNEKESSLSGASGGATQ